MESQDNASITFHNAKADRLFDIIIKKCIEKLDSLLDEYPNEKHSQQFLDIKNRYNNPELKLAVIGEFNTGKSTFINALLNKIISPPTTFQLLSFQRIYVGMENRTLRLSLKSS